MYPLLLYNQCTHKKYCSCHVHHRFLDKGMILKFLLSKTGFYASAYMLISTCFMVDDRGYKKLVIKKTYTA